MILSPPSEVSQTGIGQVVIRRARCCRFEIFYSVRTEATLEHKRIAATSLMLTVAIERVIARSHNDTVITKAAKHVVIARTGVDQIITATRLDHIIMIRPDDDVVLRRGDNILDPNAAFIAIDDVGIAIAVDNLTILQVSLDATCIIVWLVPTKNLFQTVIKNIVGSAGDRVSTLPTSNVRGTRTTGND